MAQQVCVVLSAAEREQLVAIAADRNRPRKHIERAQIVLTSADRHPVQQVAQIIGVSRSTVDPRPCSGLLPRTTQLTLYVCRCPLDFRVPS